MPPRGGPGPPAAFPWQFVVRAVAVISGLVLLLIVDVHGAGLYFAWALIVLALLSEAVATVIHRRRLRDGSGAGRGGSDR